jgi:hypothetical protein
VCVPACSARSRRAAPTQTHSAARQPERSGTSTAGRGALRLGGRPTSHWMSLTHRLRRFMSPSRAAVCSGVHPILTSARTTTLLVTSRSWATATRKVHRSSGFYRMRQQRELDAGERVRWGFFEGALEWPDVLDTDFWIRRIGRLQTKRRPGEDLDDGTRRSLQVIKIRARVIRKLPGPRAGADAVRRKAVLRRSGVLPRAGARVESDPPEPAPRWRRGA